MTLILRCVIRDAKSLQFHIHIKERNDKLSLIYVFVNMVQQVLRRRTCDCKFIE